MTFGAPRPADPSADERSLLLGFILWQREQVVATARGLTEAQMRWRPDDRLMAIGAIINHLTHMEWRWVEGRYLMRPFPSRTDEFDLDDSVTLVQLVDAYRLQAQRTESIVRAAADLEAPCLGDEGGRGPAHELMGFDTPVTLRWVLLHLIEETAHHAGHADSTREMLDGTKMRQ